MLSQNLKKISNKNILYLHILEESLVVLATNEKKT